MVCERCGADHETRGCRVTFAKAWPGKPAIKATLRAPNGSSMSVELDLPYETFRQVAEILTVAMKTPAATPSSSGPASQRGDLSSKPRAPETSSRRRGRRATKR